MEAIPTGSVNSDSCNEGSFPLNLSHRYLRSIGS
jgi:hypothetical protein